MSLTSQPSSSLRKWRGPLTSSRLHHVARTLAPTLMALAFATAAHAQGTMDFTGATTLMTTFNNRLAYVSISRASDDARIYTNNAESLGERLASNVTKTSAIDVSKLHRLSDLGGVSSRSTPEVEFEGFGIAL
jgi:hypothetical protein